MTPVLRLDSTASTNADAMALAREGRDGPLWVVAREQVGGRGRRDRPWVSPPGNLYASLLLTDPCAPEHAPQLGFLAGLAVAEAAQVLTGADRVQLKWPNDPLVDGAKLSGILVEGSRRTDGTFAAVVGIGINCRSHPSGLTYATTDLSAVAGRDVSPDDVLPVLDASLVAWLARWRRGLGFASVRDAWLARAAGLGGPVSAQVRGRAVCGAFETIDAAGRLVMRTKDGAVSVEAGDIVLGLPMAAPVLA